MRRRWPSLKQLVSQCQDLQLEGDTRPDRVHHEHEHGTNEERHHIGPSGLGKASIRGRQDHVDRPEGQLNQLLRIIGNHRQSQTVPPPRHKSNWAGSHDLNHAIQLMSKHPSVLMGSGRGKYDRLRISRQ